MKFRFSVTLASSLCLASSLGATDAVTGTTTFFDSYNAITERCVQTTRIPSGTYHADDLEDENSLCRVDLYSEDIAICPKNWSTSAAVVVYDISEGRMAGDRTKFQEKVCPGGKVAKYVAKERIARIKLTMNQANASNVYTPSPILYYHFSRYFDFKTSVPVGVWRSIDKGVFFEEVALSGVALSEGRSHLEQNHTAWTTLVDTINDPESYEKPDSFGHAQDILTADGQKVYGVMYHDRGGDPYGTEINGVSEEFEPTDDRFVGFRETPVFIALTTNAPLSQSIQIGLDTGAAALNTGRAEIDDVSESQMAFWMREMSEILLLDFILAQQDRLTNIDYTPYYYWVEDGEVKNVRAKKKKPGDGEIPADAILIARSEINDNDAGARDEYDNRAMQHRLLEGFRHFDAELYTRLFELNADLQSGGPIFQWLSTSFGLEEDQIEMIVANTLRAKEILRVNCLGRALRFDLDPEHFIATGADTVAEQHCTQF